MRVLFTYAGGRGHADPLVPVAEAVRSAGHTVAWSGRTDAGAPTSSQITPLRELDMEHEFAVLRDHYAGREAHARAEDILELGEEWGPDLIVCDEVDFGSMIAAERLGLPHITVLVTAAGSFVRAVVVAETLDALRAEHGLPPDPDLAMPSRYLVISPFPSSFRDPAFPLPPNSVVMRPGSTAPRAEDVMAWSPATSGQPVVYFTLGTAFNAESGDLFERVLAGLRALSIEVVMTVGNDIDPGTFGPQPPHVHIERYIAQATLLPRCDLVVNHGGSGSVIGALAHGLPMVVLPMGADQSLNGDRCEQLGVGIALDAVGAAPKDVRDAVTSLMDEAQFRLAAEAIRDEIAAAPGPETLVPLLEGLGSPG